MTTRSRSFGLALLALALALACLWFFDRPREQDGDARSTDIAEARVEPPAIVETLETARENDRASGVAVEARTTAANEPGAPSPGPKPCVLHVVLVRSDDGAPLADVEVFANPPPVPHQRAIAIESQRTDAAGRVDFTLPPEREILVMTRERSGDAMDFASHVARTQQTIAPFAAGEERTLRIVVPTGADLVFWGRVTSEDDGAPLHGARVTLVHHTRTETPTSTFTTDAEGFFDVRCPSQAGVECAVHADGFAALRVTLRAGHETRETAFAFPLRRGAHLDVQVLEHGVAPAKPVEVRLTTPRYHLLPDVPGAEFSDWAGEDPVWSKTCDARGVASFDDLLPRVPISAALVRAGVPEWKPTEPLNLAPGERRAVTWDLGAGTRVRVRVLDPRGAPVARREIWLTRDVLAGTPRSGRCYFYHGDSDDVVARRTTDAEGVCVFDSVAEGPWWIGPGATEYAFSRSADDVCAVGTFVDVAAGAPNVELELRVDRGLAIHGRVVDPDGKPVASAYVRAHHAIIAGQIEADTDVNGVTGEFTLAPIADGVHELYASDFEDFVDSLPVAARPGGEPVVLRLRAGARLAGVVYDLATGAHVRADVLFDPADAEGWSTSETDDVGAFEERALEPGRYHLTAKTVDGRIGILRGVELGARAARADLRIGVAPGAFVRVGYDGPAPYGQMSLFQDGACLGGDGIARGGRATHLVPAGHVTVEMRLYDGVAEPRKKTLELDVARGETKDAVFTFE